MPRLPGSVGVLIHSIGAVSNPASSSGTVNGFFDEIFGLFSTESHSHAGSLDPVHLEAFIRLHLDEAIKFINNRLEESVDQNVSRCLDIRRAVANIGR